jgi:flagellar motor switch protein FliG
MTVNGLEKVPQVLGNMDEDEIEILGNYMSNLGKIDTPVMDSVNRGFYNLFETGSSKLHTEGVGFLEPALMKVVNPVMASQVLKNITSPGEGMSGGLESDKLMTSLEKMGSSMIDEILNLRFTFEDIVRIYDNRVQFFIKEAQNEDLLVSLKTATNSLKEKLASNISERAEILQESLEFLEPMKTSEVEKAQQNISFVFKQLEENEKTLIGGGEALV